MQSNELPFTSRLVNLDIILSLVDSLLEDDHGDPPLTLPTLLANIS
jgi:hypothetical protein